MISLIQNDGKQGLFMLHEKTSTCESCVRSQHTILAQLIQIIWRKYEPSFKLCNLSQRFYGFDCIFSNVSFKINDNYFPYFYILFIFNALLSHVFGNYVLLIAFSWCSSVIIKNLLSWADWFCKKKVFISLNYYFFYIQSGKYQSNWLIYSFQNDFYLLFANKLFIFIVLNILTWSKSNVSLYSWYYKAPFPPVAPA